MQGAGIFSCHACCSTISSAEYMQNSSEEFKLIIGRKFTVAFPEWSPFKYFCIKPDQLGCCFLNLYLICQRRSIVLALVKTLEIAKSAIGLKEVNAKAFFCPVDIAKF